MRRRSTVARTSSSYLRSRLAALSAVGRLAEADCGMESSMASALGGWTFKAGRCGWPLLPEPKRDPLPEPNNDRGALRGAESDRRCSVEGTRTQGDEDGWFVGVRSSLSSSSAAKRLPFMTAWQSKECWSQGGSRAADGRLVGCEHSRQNYSRLIAHMLQIDEPARGNTMKETTAWSARESRGDSCTPGVSEGLFSAHRAQAVSSSRSSQGCVEGSRACCKAERDTNDDDRHRRR